MVPSFLIQARWHVPSTQEVLTAVACPKAWTSQPVPDSELPLSSHLSCRTGHPTASGLVHAHQSDISVAKHPEFTQSWTSKNCKWLKTSFATKWLCWELKGRCSLQSFEILEWMVGRALGLCYQSMSCLSMGSRPPSLGISASVTGMA